MPIYDCKCSQRGETKGRKKLEKKFEALISLLKSPGLTKLRDESEKYLADGKEVKLIINLEEGKPR